MYQNKGIGRLLPWVMAMLITLCLSTGALACFGTMLKVGVAKDAGRAAALAAYTLGYYVEEKTGIEPEFVLVTDPVTALAGGEVDVIVTEKALFTGSAPVERPSGALEGFGDPVIAVRPDVLEDLRFSTVDKALGRLPDFYGSSHYGVAAASDEEPKKAARKAVNDGA